MHPPDDLTLDLKHAPAGRQHPQRPGPAQETVEELGNVGAKVLAVVQHQQRLDLAQHIGHGVKAGAGRHQRHGARHRPGDRLPPGQRRQIDPPDPAGKTRRQRARQTQRQPGLAGPACPGQGEQPSLPQQIRAPGQIPGPPHERADLRREVAANRQLGTRPPRTGVMLPHPRSVTDQAGPGEQDLIGADPESATWPMPAGRARPCSSTTWPMFPGRGPGIVPGN